MTLAQHLDAYSQQVRDAYNSIIAATCARDIAYRDEHNAMVAAFHRRESAHIALHNAEVIHSIDEQISDVLTGITAQTKGE